MSREPAYREELLHWVWERAHMHINRLKSAGGQAITIYDCGIHNPADGPDFLNAQIQIGDLKWFGDIEIHWRPEDWNSHGHQTNSAFNKVILHVVWQYSDFSTIKVFRQDGTKIPILVLKDFITQPLRSFVDQYRKPEELPCSRHFSYISEKAFQQQLEQAERQYFEIKVDELLAFWDPSLAPSKAWLKLLATGLFDGLGISHNRQPMRKLLQELYPFLKRINSKSLLIDKARSILTKQLGNKSKSRADCSWSHKGSRPSNQPEARVPQAASLLWHLYHMPFQNFLTVNPQLLWEQLNQQVELKPGLGTQRKKILFGTVWLPAFFILGSTFASNELEEPIFQLWRKLRVPLPSTITQPFESLEVQNSDYKYSLGTVHQLKAFCKPRHCNKCKVFKSVISS